MKKVIACLLGIVVLAACATGRAQADQDKDGRMLADALRAVDMDGSGFDLDHQLLITGGDIPSGQAVQLHATASGGVLRNGAAKFAYRIDEGQGQHVSDYDMLVSDGRLYVKPRGSSGWKATPVGAATQLIAGLRLDVVRQAVLLASSVSTGSLTHVSAGFARRYAVMPAPAQLEQLLAVSVQGPTEQQFLKSAMAEVGVYLLVPGNKLARVEVHVAGTDPATGEKQEMLSVLDLRSAKVSAIPAPPDAMLVAPSEVLTPS